MLETQEQDYLPVQLDQVEHKDEKDDPLPDSIFDPCPDPVRPVYGLGMVKILFRTGGGVVRNFQVLSAAFTDSLLEGLIASFIPFLPVVKEFVGNY